MKRKLSGLRELKREELLEKMNKLREEWLQLRFQHAAHQLKNPVRQRWVRRDIARIETLLGEKKI